MKVLLIVSAASNMKREVAMSAGSVSDLQDAPCWKEIKRDNNGYQQNKWSVEANRVEQPG